MTRRRFPLLGLLLLAGALVHGCQSAESDREIAQLIRKQIQPAGWFPKRATVDDDDIQPLVRRFYKARRYLPAWTHIDGPTNDARELLQSLVRSQEEGLDPENYDVERLQAAMEKLHGAGLSTESRTREIAALDLELTRNFLKNATHRFSGQVQPLQLSADWHVKARTQDMVPVLAEAIGTHRIDPTLASLSPRNPQYARLREALAEYRRIEQQGGWPVIPPGPALKRGSSGARVDSLQHRLKATGDLGGGYAAGRFDGATDAAVRRFEASHGLDVDGLVGREDLAELNRPVSHRIRQIEMNMERWRWLSDSLMTGRYLVVNVPDFSLRAVEDTRTVLQMRVVVGKDSSRTPMFMDEISYLVLNPNWNVPASIARDEILPAVQEDESYLQKNNMRVFENETNEAAEVDPTHVHWASMSPEDFHYAIRQDPGPDNPVGHVKFMCPNQFNVYLHDTPSDQLFAARERAFSHGCIRVEKPVDLAVYLLSDEGWDSTHVESEFETADNKSVKLARPIPVRILYWTAFFDDHDVLQFREDVYGFDSLLDRTIRRRGNDIQTPLRMVTSPSILDS